MRRLGDISDACASGLMRVAACAASAGSTAVRLSDHADWPALLDTIAETGARVVATHGHAEPLARHLTRQRAPGRRHSHRLGRRRGADDQMIASRTSTRRRSAQLHQREGRGDGAVTSARAARRCRVGGVLPTGRRLKRLVPAPGISDWAMAATGIRTGCSRNATRSSATARRPPRSCSKWAVEPPRSGPLSAGSRSVSLPLRDAIRPLSRRTSPRGGRSTLAAAAVHAPQAADRRIPIGVSQTLVVRALAEAAALPATTIAARLMGEWTPVGPSGSATCSSQRRNDRADAIAPLPVLPRVADRRR